MANWSGLWNNQYGENYSGLGVNSSEISNNEKMRLARGFRGRAGRVLGALINALSGTAAGGATATHVYKQIAGDPALDQAYSGGGARVINTNNDINRLTTAADVTNIDALTALKTGPATYPTDKSGNGGGGKGGVF